MSGGVLTIGEGLGVLRTRGFGSLAHEPDLVVGTGGAEGNVAIGLARLGTPVTWLGRVGDDGLGTRVVRELRAEGVAVVAPVDPAAATGLLIKESPSPGRTVVTYHRAGSAGSRLSPSDLEPVDLEGFDLLHVTGITPALSASARAAIDAAVDGARAAGVRVSFDVNHRRSLWPDAAAAAECYRSLASRADLVFAGDEEAALVTGLADAAPAALARAIAGLGPTEVVVKLGDRGALALGDGAVAERPAVPVGVVDTVGAGDAFVAGYLAARLAGEPVAARLDLAVRTGAAACTHPGDWEGFPTRRDLDRRPGQDPVAR
ncbi:2-dehydro-3-deoxygluconokinase [Agromyces flavus]|uniref:2-dehydro-3-deoxygluconokinase n=1 Tax=Agromyces flavus TaxID=589382 RepID=A0A1H1W9U2_9MICO|nr:sugar kinase [Agromyces flavus]MCP2366121.1 2-dehydro-3-deoxygluconokinase [Agromyces flavus]GGI44042.1 sugar kinase [Agromyces flavus]SDS93863.1 2-dehydro-3-deoxygluconokinase [Agromyces flavus]